MRVAATISAKAGKPSTKGVTLLPEVNRGSLSGFGAVGVLATNQLAGSSRSAMNTMLSDQCVGAVSVALGLLPSGCPVGRPLNTWVGRSIPNVDVGGAPPAGVTASSTVPQLAAEKMCSVVDPVRLLDTATVPVNGWSYS